MSIKDLNNTNKCKPIYGVEDKIPNIFECLEADMLGGRLGSKKWVQANFTWPKFSEVWKS